MPPPLFPPLIMSQTNVVTIIKKELRSYFATPMALTFIVVFLALSNAFTFYLGRFFDVGQASMDPFFAFHPWLYLLLVPAIAMRLWAEERKSGTMELLLTLPISTAEAVVGKFLAAWLIGGLALLFTFPLLITVNWLGDPDNGVILTGYLSSFLMMGSFLAIGSCLSAATKNQVIAFILGATVCFLFTMSGLEMVLNFFRAWAPEILVNAIASMSMLTHYQTAIKGVIDLRDLLFFLSIMVFWLMANIILVELRKAG